MEPIRVCIACGELKECQFKGYSPGGKPQYTPRCKECHYRWRRANTKEVKRTTKPRKCFACKKIKPAKEFDTDRKDRLGIARQCKSCKAKSSKKWRESGKGQKNALLRRERNQQEKREYVRQYLLNNPCSVCGETDICVLEFDHIDPEEKSYNISYLMSKNHCISTLIQEMEKCRVMCANCHKKHTSKQQGWWK